MKAMVVKKKKTLWKHSAWSGINLQECYFWFSIRQELLWPLARLLKSLECLLFPGLVCKQNRIHVNDWMGLEKTEIQERKGKMGCIRGIKPRVSSGFWLAMGSWATPLNTWKFLKRNHTCTMVLLAHEKSNPRAHPSHPVNCHLCHGPHSEEGQ